MRILVWLGARRTLVGQLVLLEIDDIVSLVTGIPPTRTTTAGGPVTM